MVGRYGFIISHMIDPTRNAFFYQISNNESQIVNGCESPFVIKCSQRPGNTFSDYIIQKIQIPFISGAVYHAGTENIHTFTFRDILG